MHSTRRTVTALARHWKHGQHWLGLEWCVTWAGEQAGHLQSLLEGVDEESDRSEIPNAYLYPCCEAPANEALRQGPQPRDNIRAARVQNN